ncbi:MAG: hypothetical protein AAGB35_01085 [Pseudomonadota bacterium]
MEVKQYRALTHEVLSALRNFNTCVSQRERNYALSLISQVSYEASIAQCQEADQTDLEKMDFALKLVLELIKDHPIPKVPMQELQIALH